MELAAATTTWMKARIASRHQAPHIVVVRHHDNDEEAAEVCAVDLHGNVINSTWIRRPIVSPLSIHGDVLCASHGWALTSMVDMVTGAVADVGVDRRKKVNSATPYCVVGHVPATGEYKVLRIQADYCCRRRRQTCEVMTLGVNGGGDTDAGRWRRRTCPRVTLWSTMSTLGSSRDVVVVAGLVYFLGLYDMEDGQPLKKDSIAVFDLATEEWRPRTLQGPLTSSILAGGDDDESAIRYKDKVPDISRVYLLCWKHFQLARLGDSLVVVYCNMKKSLTQLWFMEDMVDDTTAAPRWSKRYTLQGTRLGDDRYSPMYHYPLAVLDDGRILVWVERKSKLMAYDPETCTWTDLATLTGDCVVGVHKQVCSSLRAALPSSCTIL